MAKKRINLTIDPSLHAWAQARAEKEGTNLSAFVSELLKQERRDRGNGGAKLSAADVERIRVGVAEELLAKLGQQRDGAKRG